MSETLQVIARAYSMNKTKGYKTGIETFTILDPARLNPLTEALGITEETNEIREKKRLELVAMDDQGDFNNMGDMQIDFFMKSKPEHYSKLFKEFTPVQQQTILSHFEEEEKKEGGRLGLNMTTMVSQEDAAMLGAADNNISDSTLDGQLVSSVKPSLLITSAESTGVVEMIKK